jgi:hypothetical protein
MQRLNVERLIAGLRRRITSARHGHLFLSTLLPAAAIGSTLILAGCGGGVSITQPAQAPLTLTGNWQFNMAPPGDGSFSGGLQGGFLQQGKDKTATGSVAYSVSLPGRSNACDTGNATISGTLDGQTVNLTATAGSQTFTLTGTISFDGTTMAGTYSSTSGTASGGGAPCGTAQSGLQWNAVLVPSITGPIAGTLHSSGGSAGLNEQNFLVSGALVQANTFNSSSAAVTGNLNFTNAISGLSNYPCLSVASLQGQISGNTVTLQIVGDDNSNIGQIGDMSGSTNLGTVILDHVGNGYVLHSLSGNAYAIFSAACGGGTLQAPADFGSICLGLNSIGSCAQPVTFTPSPLIFDFQLVGTTTFQTITITNKSSSTLNQLSLALTDQTVPGVYSETDTCAPSVGAPFFLSAGQSCIVTVYFAPQCAGSCPLAMNATLALNSPGTIFTVAILGTAEMAAAPEIRDRRQVQADLRFRDWYLPGLTQFSGNFANRYLYE